MQVLFVTTLVKESTAGEATSYFYIPHFRYVVESLAKDTMGVISFSKKDKESAKQYSYVCVSELAVTNKAIFSYLLWLTLIKDSLGQRRGFVISFEDHFMPHDDGVDQTMPKPGYELWLCVPTMRLTQS
jgi:hypothetical protein